MLLPRLFPTTLFFRPIGRGEMGTSTSTSTSTATTTTSGHDEEAVMLAAEGSDGGLEGREPAAQRREPPLQVLRAPIRRLLELLPHPLTQHASGSNSNPVGDCFRV